MAVTEEETLCLHSRLPTLSIASSWGACRYILTKEGLGDLRLLRVTQSEKILKH